jgi:hypothetical protein
LKKNILKKFLHIIFLLFLTSISIFAQKPKVQNNPEYDDHPIRFGFSVGLNTMDFSFGRNFGKSAADTLFADVSELVPGFQVNIVSSYRLGEYFNIRFLPGIAFGQRNLDFYSAGGTKVNSMKIESSFLDFPLLIKYKAKRLNNCRPYLIGGVAVRYDMASRKSYDKESKQYVILKPIDFYYELGFGVDYYLQYFKFSTELKLSVGVRNVINKPSEEAIRPEYARAIDRLTSQLVMFSLNFE